LDGAVGAASDDKKEDAVGARSISVGGAGAGAVGAAADASGVAADAAEERKQAALLWLAGGAAAGLGLS